MLKFYSIFFLFTLLLNPGHSYINNCPNDPFVNIYPKSNDLTLKQYLLDELKLPQYPWFTLDESESDNAQPDCSNPAFTCRTDTEDSHCFDKTTFCFKKGSVPDTTFAGVIPVITTHGYYSCETVTPPTPTAQITKLYYAGGLFKDTNSNKFFSKDVFEVDIKPLKVKKDLLQNIGDTTIAQVNAGVYIIQRLKDKSANEDGVQDTSYVIVLYAYLEYPTLKVQLI